MKYQLNITAAIVTSLARLIGEVRAARVALAALGPRPTDDTSTDTTAWYTGWYGILSGLSAQFQTTMEGLNVSLLDETYYHLRAELSAALERWVLRPIGQRGGHPQEDVGDMVALEAFLTECMSEGTRETRCRIAMSAITAGAGCHGNTTVEMKRGIGACLDADLDGLDRLHDERDENRLLALMQGADF